MYLLHFLRSGVDDGFDDPRGRSFIRAEDYNVQNFSKSIDTFYDLPVWCIASFCIFGYLLLFL